MPVTSPGSHLGFWLTGCRLEFLMICLCLINFLEQLTELKRSILLPRLAVYDKRVYSGTRQMEEMYRARYGGKCRMWSSMPSLRLPLSPNLPQFPITEALRTLSLWVFMEASLGRNDWLDHWWLISFSSTQPPSPPQRLVVGVKVPTLWSGG